MNFDDSSRLRGGVAQPAKGVRSGWKNRSSWGSKACVFLMELTREYSYVVIDALTWAKKV